MATPAAQKRIAELREQIEKANYDYYILDQPTLDDFAYDAILRELQEPKHAVDSPQRGPEGTAGRPTWRPG